MFMTTFLREFQSWYWNCDFDDTELQAALDATDAATTPDEFQRAFLVLLRSEDTVARGTALDFFDRAATTSRFGEANPFAPYREEVLAVAREMLRHPPRPGDDIAFEGADHASALLGLKNDAGPEDAEAVLAVLRRRPDGELLFNALWAAQTALGNSETPDPRLVSLIGEMAFDRSLDIADRRQALSALRDATGAAATELLVRATGEDDYRFQQEAAWALSIGERFYAHRTLLERLDASWPDDERGFAASEVHEALGPGPHSTYWRGVAPESPGLLRAHGEMRAPTSKRAHRQGFRTMLYSGLVPMVGIALDHFCDGDGLARFDLDVKAFEPNALALARHLLALSPSSANASPETGAGASHASALDVLALLAEPEDAALLAAALRRRDTAPLVRERALRAAQDCLDRWDEPDDRVVSALEELIFDSSADMEARTLAVIALFDVPGSQVTAVLLRAAHSSVLPVQIEGALGLTCAHLIDQHRDLVRGLVASWPGGDDEPDRAWLVRAALRD
ncbi:MULTISPECIES: hypothetical protein [Streptomyces violaceusniger group]|uniref:HEAT repeat domain-containing protein n=2 Tax=Streptomyces javensis TaxID=114698 RepID=A0ABS0RJ77_9ACTN|nr:hypothetical protein [Streptomyces javensis]MBI0317035.1 hypothetical protein [Streptomyces javensis]